LQDIAGGQSKNLSVTSCSGFHDEVEVESDAPTATYIDQLFRDASYLPEDLPTLMQASEGVIDKMSEFNSI